MLSVVLVYSLLELEGRGRVCQVGHDHPYLEGRASSHSNHITGRGRYIFYMHARWRKM